MLSNANKTAMYYDDIDDKFWEGRRMRMRKRAKLGPVAKNDEFFQ